MSIHKKSSDQKKKSKIVGIFNKFSSVVTRVTGRPVAFIIAVLVVLIWAITGPVFDYSDTWQLVINTGTTIITFLMVFVIQHSQNKDTGALQIKLDELIAASRANNELIDVEALDDEEIEELKKFYSKLRSKNHEDVSNNPPGQKKKKK